MSTYILLTKLSAESLGELKSRKNIAREWLDTVKQKCPEVKWIDHYALLGPFDFMDIYEAPNEEVAAKISMITMSKGAVKAETWTAIPYKRYLDITSSM
jgi:uncharacterized protein with GYD domain